MIFLFCYCVRDHFETMDSVSWEEARQVHRRILDEDGSTRCDVWPGATLKGVWEDQSSFCRYWPVVLATVDEAVAYLGASYEVVEALPSIDDATLAFLDSPRWRGSL